MGRIQSGIGLVTGTDIQGTVDQLIKISSVPRDRLIARTEGLQKEQQAIAELTATVIGVQLSAKKFASESLFQTRTTSSSNDQAVSVEAEQGAPVGTYAVHGLQLAGTHATQSKLQFAATDEPLGFAGQIDVRSGGTLDQSMDLRDLNGGRGVQAGSIRITDRSGAIADVDLSKSRTMEDVLRAINETAGIEIRASADHDRIILTDRTGQTTSNLRVEDIGDGETAADLGLWGIDVAADQASGMDITSQDPEVLLQTILSDEGAQFVAGNDLQINLADGTTLDIDLGDVDPNTPPATVEELLDQLNAIDPGKLSAAISDDGDSIVISDLTAGVGTFSIADVNGAAVASVLGIDGSSATGTIESPPTSPALAGVSLRELGGGQGLGNLTSVDITLRDGSTANVDVSEATTIQQVIESLNSSGLALTAKLDDSRTGIRLRDLSGGSDVAFTISSADDTASLLGIEASSNETIVDGRNLHRQTVDRSTLLADLNQGTGIGLGSIKLTDSDGNSSAISLKQLEISSVGELIDEINSLGIAMTADINESGDGIQIIDTGSGTNAATIANVGSATTATDLGIVGEATEQTIDGLTVNAFVGGERLSIAVDATDSLEAIAEKINAEGRFVEATIVSGDDNQKTIRIRSLQGGDAGTFSIDTSGFELGLETIRRGQDAELLVQSDDGIQRFLSSADGVFVDEASALTLTLKEISDQPVTVSVKENPDSVVKAGKTFVDQYNKLVEKLKSLTFFNADTNQVGLLFGSSETLRIETSFSRLLSGAVRGNGEITSLAEVGLSLNDNGKLSLSESKLKARLASDPEAVEQFFTKEETGLAARLDQLAERIAGSEHGLLMGRNETLTRQIEQNRDRVETLNERLENERERLLKQFYSVEEAIAKLQSNQQYISQIQPVTFPNKK
ncbi:MAG: flagellar filament capping protein FliD [Pirellulaceae bacterium]